MKQILILIVSIIFFQGANAQQTVGLFTQNPGSLDGYVLFAPVRSDSTYLIDKCGKEIHKWLSTYMPGLSAYLLPDGSLLRAGDQANPVFSGNGSLGGIIERYDWNGNLTWSYVLSDSLEMQNHDICPMPNGNVLVAVWEKINYTQAISAGRNPAFLGTNVWSAKVIELEPVGSTQANIVWQWRLWDHLIQHYDSAKSNYGIVADHPELLNLNYVLGAPTNPDWIHLNSLTYNSTLDQVMISSRALSEIYIIDHSTTIPEAASHTGGIHGKGGDFLYRWGNPAAYNRGTVADKTLYFQHNPVWIPDGYKDENKIMIFNNGLGRPGGNSSSVDVIDPPVDSSGNYTIVTGQPFGPTTAAWTYQAPVPADFFSSTMGGAVRLSNGNTLICEANKGNLFEIDSNKNIVWKYVNPVGNTGPVSQGTTTNKNGVFHCKLYEPNYSGFIGQTLTPGNPIELNPLAYNCTMLTGIDEIKHNDDFIVQISNPFTDEITIQSDKDMLNERIILKDLTGRVITEWSGVDLLQNQTIKLKPRTLTCGIYFLKFDKSISKILIKQ
jgi:hypothetical protein